jgi:YD repeat-containing protein
MAKVVNYLILLLIFVFDPLAVALILITNRVFQIESGQYIPEPEVAKRKKESILAKIKNYKRKIKEVKHFDFKKIDGEEKNGGEEITEYQYNEFGLIKEKVILKSDKTIYKYDYLFY